MIGEENITGFLTGYENSLIKQFHAMEMLVEISKKERELIVKGMTDALMKETEEKEAVLDKLSLLEEKSRTLLEKIALKIRLDTERTKIQDVLPYLNGEDAERIIHLIDGINTLAASAKEINMGNQALVLTRMEWIKATQSFVVLLMQPENAYPTPMMAGRNRDSSISSMEYTI